jgi:hypothetical protein
MWMNTLFGLLIILCANKFFDLGSWWHQSGVFNVADVGNGLTWAGTAILLFRRKEHKILWNPISVLVFLYLLFVMVHVSLAALYYGQGLFDGIVGVRHQFYYMSFPLFLLLLDDTRKMIRLLDALAFASVIVALLGTVNYFGSTFISHKYAAGHGIRSGITRAYIPGMPIVSLSALWMFTRWVDAAKNKGVLGCSSVFFLALHFFRQSRMRLFGVVTMVTGLLIVRKRRTAVLVLLALTATCYGILEFTMEENVITTPFTTAYENVVNQTGSWRPRLKQLEVDIQEFLDHPWMGSGVSAIRAPTQQGGTRLQIEMAALSYESDLGYSHWLKSYGTAGIVWLMLFFSFQAAVGFRIQKTCEADDRTLALFALSYFGFVVGSFITLNHLMLPWGITLVCLNAAIMVRIDWNARKKTFDA